MQKRRIDVQLSDEELNQRRKNWSPPPYKVNRGALYKVDTNLINYHFSPFATKDHLHKIITTLFVFQYIKNVQSASYGCVTDE